MLKTFNFILRNPQYILLPLGALVGAFSIAVLLHAKDAEMREVLAAQAKSIDLALDWSSAYGDLAGAAGEASPQETPKLATLRERMAKICAVYPNCRAVYLMRQNANKQIYFLVDSSPKTSPIYVVPGTVYSEASTIAKNVFLLKQPATEGPVRDRWGTWISAYVPHTLPDQSALVIGIDVDAKDWNWILIQSVAMPALTTLAFLALIIFYSNLWQAKASQNITLQRSNEILAKQQYEDELTGLPNRSYFELQLKQLVRGASHTASKFAVFYLDLDQAVAIDERLGSAVGEELLRVVARRLSSAVRAEATVARLSADQFAVLLCHVEHASDAELSAQKMMNVLASPIELGGQSLNITASIGVAMSSDACKTELDMVYAADVAMHIAKRAGGNQYHLFKQGDLPT